LPRNLELKCRIGSLQAAEAAARGLGATDHGMLIQEDTYFVVPNGRLKLRVHKGGASELIAYERPNRSGERWSNYRKVDVSASAGLREALVASLGILCVVRKQRHLFLVPEARIHLDSVEGLGTFIEFEVTMEGESDAAALMAELCRAFGVRPEEGIGESYSDLVMEGRE
jgi:predicted adenylyl cyclase CyaB